MKSLLFTLLIIASAIGCKPEGTLHNRDLTLQYKNAHMPIWVRGATDSKKILLYLHGGPGECSFCLRPYFEGIEKSALVAYWDQRAAGSSRGNAGPESMNYAQYADDLKQVVLLLRSQYPGYQVYLFGHSFGVELGWQFLTTNDNQSLVQGFVAMNGTYATYPWLRAVQAWAIEAARAKSDTEAFRFFQEQPADSLGLVQQLSWGDWYSRMFSLGANPVWPSDDPAYSRWLRWWSPHNRLSQAANTARYDAYYAREIFTFHRAHLLGQVNIPVRIFWGTKDGIMPFSIALATQAQLSQAAEIVRFENSWHSAFHTETDKFTTEMLRFMGIANQ